MSASPARQWKRHTAPQEITVPSGNVALVRRPDSIRVFMSEGFIPNSLLPIVERSIKSGGGEDSVDTEELTKEVLSNSALLTDMAQMQDNIVLKCVVEPLVAPIPKYTQKHVDEGLVTEQFVGTEIPFGHPHREHGYTEETLPLFVDEVDAEDKKFIYQFCMGGTADLERFRDKSAATVAAVDDVAGHGSETV